MKLSALQFWSAGVALTLIQGLAFLFLDSAKAAVVTGMVTTLFALLISQKPKDEAPAPQPALIAPEEQERPTKPSLKIISGGLALVLALACAGSQTSCSALNVTTQDGSDFANHVNALDNCENVAAEVKKTVCDGGVPCQPGVDAYVACKKDGGL